MAAAGGLTYTVAEFNTIITMLGCLCATVQAATGYHAAYRKKKIGLLKSNEVLFRAHRAFGGFATTLYFLGLFAGLVGFFGGIFFNTPPVETESPSYNIHVWPSFLVMIVIIWKSYISYFKKKSVYRKGKYLGMATFGAWAFTWISAAFSYYIRTTPANPQHPPPRYLMPIEFLWLQILWPFLWGAIIGVIIIYYAQKLERKKVSNT